MLLTVGVALPFAPLQITGLAVLRELQVAASATKAVLLFAQIDSVTLMDALRYQARGIVQLETALQLLIPCILEVTH